MEAPGLRAHSVGEAVEKEIMGRKGSKDDRGEVATAMGGSGWCDSSTWTGRRRSLGGGRPSSAGGGGARACGKDVDGGRGSEH